MRCERRQKRRTQTPLEHHSIWTTVTRKEPVRQCTRTGWLPIDREFLRKWNVRRLALCCEARKNNNCRKESEMRLRGIRFSMLVALTSMLGSGVIHAQEPGTKAAQMSVEAWLSLIDNQSHAASWYAAASIFRNVSDN
jgi:hypothetical protein